MGLVQDSISGFIGGVSQQPDKLMFPNQAKELVNMIPDVNEGLCRRKPTENITRLTDSYGDLLPACYTVNKENEKYEIILDGKGIKVFDLGGVEREVNFEDSHLYEGGYTVSDRNLTKRDWWEYSFVDKEQWANKEKRALYRYSYQFKDPAFTLYLARPMTKNKSNTAYYHLKDTNKAFSIGTLTNKNWKNDSILLSLTIKELVLDNEIAVYYYEHKDENLKGTKLYVDSTMTTTYGYITEHNEEEKTIVIGDVNSALTYIATTEPLKDLTMANIGDYTFITNKTIVPQMADIPYPNPYPKSALIFVEQGDYSIDYSVTINGSTTVSYTTSSTDRKTIKTTTIAKKLYDGLVSKLGTTNWDFQIKNSTILIQNKKKEAFTIATSDSNSDENMYCFYNETESFTYLPAVAPNGYIIKITGENGDSSDDYYVKFHTSDNCAFGAGVWKECCAPDMLYHIDSSTMPHALIRESDGTFTFKAIDWTDRGAGDEDTAKTPLMLGSTPIKEVFTHKGRLAFVSGDRTVYSDTQDIFSFFKKTVVTYLDTDPIEINSNSKMVDLYHTLAYNNDLLLFSPTSVFTVSSGDVFSNSTVNIDLTMEYPCSSLCKPIAIGNTCLFLYDNGTYSGLYEIYTASTYTTAARSITEHVPRYLPTGFYKMTAQTQSNIVCMLSKNEPNNIYVYNFYYNSEQKVQSAWHKWTFEGKILNADFVNNYLYLVIQYDDGVYLEKLNVTPSITEEGLEYLFYLDRKTYLDEGVYSSEENITTFELPYPVDDTQTNFMVLSDNGFPLTFEIEENTLKVKGEYTNVVIGFTYKSLWELSTIYQRQTTSSGGSKVVEGLLMLGDINLTYINTSDFEVNVIPKYTSQQASYYKFTGTILGTASALLGAITPHSGDFLIPIMSKNDDVTVQISTSNYLPCNFVSLIWLGEFSQRGK